MSEPDDRHDTDGDEDGQDGGSILDDGGIDTDERAGRSQGIDVDSEPDDETKQDMEEERERRLDPDNRPENAEVDNTQRDFDVEQGMFTDNEDYDESADPAYPGEDDPESGADDAVDDDDEDEAPDDGSEPDDAPEDVQEQEQEEERS